MDKNTQEFYDRLKVELDLKKYMATYLFKFIVPSENDNIDRVQLAFDCMGR
jgi:hypothetical protein